MFQESLDPFVDAAPSYFFPGRERKKVANSRFLRALVKDATERAEGMKQSEFDFILSLQRLDEYKAYKHIGYRSLVQFCIKALKFTEAMSITYVMVARKAVECEKLQEALRDQKITSATARKILSVMTVENQDHWLDLAMTLTTRNLEKEIAQVSPRAAKPDQTRYVSKDTLRYEINVSEEADQDLRRAKELICEKMGRSVSLDEVLGVLAKEYVTRHDPMKKAERAIKRKAKRAQTEVSLPPKVSQGDLKAQKSFNNKNPQEDTHGKTVHVNGKSQLASHSQKKTVHVNGKKNLPVQKKVSLKRKTSQRIPVPAPTRNEVFYRDQGQCAHMDSQGERCEAKIFLQMHHKIQVSDGGSNDLSNLELLCFWHHQQLHEKGF
jgi:5-methylcytosine-specific restriction endonuclease McrA